MKPDLKSMAIGLAAGLVIAAAAAQAQQAPPEGHEHDKAAPTSQQAAPGPQPKAGMMQGTDSDRMMAHPQVRQQMMAQMRQCHDMMSRMMAHMEAMGQHGQQQHQPQRQ